MAESSLEISNLSSIWGSKTQMPFDLWVKSVFELASLVSPEKAAKIVGTNPAEIEAVIRLAILSDEELGLLAKSPPPITTWFLLARMSFDEIKEALVAISNCPPGTPPSSVLKFNLEHIKSAKRTDSIKRLDANTFKVLSKLAKEFGVLNDKSRNALYSFGTRREKGQELTDAQAQWAISMFEDLIAGGVLKVDKQNHDAEMFIYLIELLQG